MKIEDLAKQEKEFIEKLKNGCIFASETLQFVKEYQKQIAFLENMVDFWNKETQRLATILRQNKIDF